MEFANGTTSLAAFASASCQHSLVSPVQLANARDALLSYNAKLRAAQTCIAEAQAMFDFSGVSCDALAAGLADPRSREDAMRQLLDCPRITGSTSIARRYESMLDAMFGDNGAATFVLPIPARWSRDVWHAERTLSAAGYEYNHWVYATLPATFDWHHRSPIAFTLLSDGLSGTLYWGGRTVYVHHGEVTVTPDYASIAKTELFDRVVAPSPQ